jgi:hypothetical protein
MIEKINLSTFKLTSNYVLLLVDSNYNFKTLKGPNGKEVKLEIANFGEQSINHVSISGTIIAMPEKTYFYDIADFDTIPRDEHAANMKESLNADCEFPIVVGDKVYFNYSNQINAEAERRLVDTDEHGICMLAHLNTLFGYEKGGDILPLNGNVFFVRDVEPDEMKLQSGLVVINHADKYGSAFGTIKSADKRVKRYLEGGNDPYFELLPGQRIVIDKKFGYRMAYDMHGGILQNIEVILRKNIVALI